MKSLKILSIVGLGWFGLCFICIVSFMNNDIDVAVGWGIWAVLYGIALAVVSLVKANKHIDK